MVNLRTGLWRWVLVGAAIAVGTTAVALAAGPVAPVDFGFEDVPYVQQRGVTNRADEVLNVNTTTTYDSIQAAVTAATAGDTLRVTANLSEGQVLFDKNLTLEGLTGTEVVSASVSTGDGSSGDNKGWFVVDTGVSLVVQDLVFDGTGYDIYQGFRHKGSGTFSRCTFRNIAYPTYFGVAIAVAGGGTFTIEDCVFESIGRLGVLASYSTTVTIQRCSYTGKGSGDQLDYAAQVDSGSQTSFLESTATDCSGTTGAGDSSAGVFVTTANGAGSDLVVTSCTFLNNTSGAVRGIDGSADSATMSAAFNRFFGNGTGIWDTIATMDAENNWFGCNGGPTDTVNCDGVTGTPDADPWLVLSLAASPASILPGQSSTLTADLNSNSDSVDVSGFGSVVDGTTIAFGGGALGSVLPASSGTVSGVATSTFTAGGSGGVTSVTATLDNETVNVSLPVPVELLGFSVE